MIQDVFDSLIITIYCNCQGEQDFDRSYEENKKKFWKEVRRVKKGGSRTEETVKDVNGRLLRGNE